MTRDEIEWWETTVPHFGRRPRLDEDIPEVSTQRVNQIRSRARRRTWRLRVSRPRVSLGALLALFIWIALASLLAYLGSQA